MIERVRRRFPAILMAYRNLSRTKIRSLLASLGIVIGVLAIASLGMFGVALQYSISQNLGDIGNQLTVSPSYENGHTELTRREVRDIERIVASNVTVSPIVSAQRTVSYTRGETTTTSIYALERPEEIYSATSGQIPVPFRSGALIGTTVAEDHGLQPGNTISVSGDTVRVRAVLASPNGTSQLNPDSRIFLPIRSFDSQTYTQVHLTAQSGTQANATAMAIRSELNSRERRVEVSELGAIVDRINDTFQTINTILIGIASISLLVAGISILNVMLMSTVERREEIGVLRAVGYQKRDVLKVMLTEATLLGVIGGIIGIGGSLIAGLAIYHYTIGDMTAVFRFRNGLYIAAAFGFGIVVSIISGLYPAWKAASAEPVEALRS